MFDDRNRGKRAAAEVRALRRKAQRNGSQLSGREAARLTKVSGRVVKYGMDSEDYSDDRQY